MASITWRMSPGCFTLIKRVRYMAPIGTINLEHPIRAAVLTSPLQTPAGFSSSQKRDHGCMCGIPPGRRPPTPCCTERAGHDSPDLMHYQSGPNLSTTDFHHQSSEPEILLFSRDVKNLWQALLVKSTARSLHKPIKTFCDFIVFSHN